MYPQTGYLGLPSFETNPLAWHPALMVGGVFMGQIFAILTWSVIPTPTIGMKQVAKTVHVLFNTGSAGCMIASLIAIVKHSYKYKLESLTTLHSWVGVISVCVFGVTYMWGAVMALLTAFAPDSNIRKAIDLRLFHR